MTLQRTCLAIRWVVLFTGFTATDDYRPTASRGVTLALTEEITKMCIAFHPVAQIHRLPQDSPVFLFWRARSTRDWVITRISIAPNPHGLRTALEYCTLLLDEDAFRALRYNPFRTRSLNLHDRVRRHHLAGRAAPFDYELQTDTKAQGPEADAPRREFPDITGDHVSTDANVGAIQEFCSRWTADPIAPPTFATWWASRGAPPAGYFDIVLHAPEPRSLTLQEARDAITQLCADLKASLPTPASSDLAAVDLVRSLLAEAANAEDAVTHAAAYVHNATAEVLQTQLTETALKINRLRLDLGSLLTRLEGSLPEDDIYQLQSLAGRSQEIEQGMQSIRHPNPFRKVSVGTTETAAVGDARGSNQWPAKQATEATQPTHASVSPKRPGRSDRSFPISHSSGGERRCRFFYRFRWTLDAAGTADSRDEHV